MKHLPNYPITHIGWNTLYARQFLKVPNVSFNMLQKIMVGPIGSTFMRDIRKAGRSLFLWTVNDEEWMKWSIRKDVDGVITDDPKKYLEVCRNYDGEAPKLEWRQWRVAILFQILALVYTFVFRARFGFRVDARKVRIMLMEARQGAIKG